MAANPEKRSAVGAGILLCSAAMGEDAAEVDVVDRLPGKRPLFNFVRRYPTRFGVGNLPEREARLRSSEAKRRSPLDVRPGNILHCSVNGNRHNSSRIQHAACDR